MWCCFYCCREISLLSTYFCNKGDDDEAIFVHDKPPGLYFWQNATREVSWVAEKTCDRKSKKDSDKCLVFPEKKRDFATFLTSTTFLFNAYPPESNGYQWIKFLPNMIEKNAKNCSEFQKSCPISISMCYRCFNKCLELFSKWTLVATLRVLAAIKAFKI